MKRLKDIITWRLSLIEAALFLSFARFVVVFLPFKVWTALFNDIVEETDVGTLPQGDDYIALRKPRRLAGAVSRVAPLLPFQAVCLPQAMALYWMMRWRGYHGMKISYGTRISSQQEFQAHAWLTLDDTVLIGWHDGTFSPIASLR
ncbi:MAG: lasso peptide biosynthesis B2 protein [Alphaproteobacteria bacterium]